MAGGLVVEAAVAATRVKDAAAVEAKRRSELKSWRMESAQIHKVGRGPFFKRITMWMCGCQI